MNSETKSMEKGNEYFIKEIEDLKENHVEILKIMNSVREIKNELGSRGNRADQIKERIHDI